MMKWLKVLTRRMLPRLVKPCVRFGKCSAEKSNISLTISCPSTLKVPSCYQKSLRDQWWRIISNKRAWTMQWSQNTYRQTSIKSLLPSPRRTRPPSSSWRNLPLHKSWSQTSKFKTSLSILSRRLIKRRPLSSTSFLLMAWTWIDRRTTPTSTTTTSPPWRNSG